MTGEIGHPKKRPAAVLQDTTSDKCSIVAQVILETQDLPERVRNMLVSGLHECLQVPHAKRHAFHAEIVQMVSAVLAKTEAGLQEQVQAAEVRVRTVVAKQAQLDAECKQVVAKLRAKEAHVETQREALAKCNIEFEKAKSALANEESLQLHGDAPLKAAEVAKEKLESALSSTYIPLRDGAFNLEDAKRHAAELGSLVERHAVEHGFDASLAAAFPHALELAPSVRSMFNVHIVQEVENELSRLITKLSEELASAAPARRDRMARVAVATEELVTAGKHERTCTGELTVALDEQGQAETELKAVERAIGQVRPEVDQAKAALDLTKANMEEFCQGPLATFQGLAAAGTGA